MNICILERLHVVTKSLFEAVLCEIYVNIVSSVEADYKFMMMMIRN